MKYPTLETHIETRYAALLQRVAYRQTCCQKMAWLFDASNTLPVVPDYLQFGSVGNNEIERFINRQLCAFSRNLWFHLFWPKIQRGIITYTTTTYVSKFFKSVQEGPMREDIQCLALNTLEEALHRNWDNLPLCTFYEVGTFVTEALHECIRLLHGPEDVFLSEKIRQNQVCLDFLQHQAQDVFSHPQYLDILVYWSCQANWIDSLEGDMATFLPDLEEKCAAVMTDPNILKRLRDENPHYHIHQFESFISGAPKTILYECDNCGEVVFDLLLVQYLVEQGHRVVLGVKDRPALNDALVQDVERLLTTELFVPLAQALHTGQLSLLPIPTAIGGKLLYEVSEEYQCAYTDVDFLILKGQGNFQTMPMGVRRRGRFIPYCYRKPMFLLMPVKSMMSRLCLGSIFRNSPPRCSLFLYYYHPFDPATYPS